MLPLLIALVTAEEPAPMIAPPWVFAAIAASIFILLAIITYSFRDVANRHADKTSAGDHQSSHH
jgi:hypothetical protein